MLFLELWLHHSHVIVKLFRFIRTCELTPFETAGSSKTANLFSTPYLKLDFLDNIPREYEENTIATITYEPVFSITSDDCFVLMRIVFFRRSDEGGIPLIL